MVMMIIVKSGDCDITDDYDSSDSDNNYKKLLIRV